MSQPKIVAFLVRCTESLLICEDIPTDHLRFRDMPDCTQQLPSLIDRMQSRLFGQVVMGRCHYLLGKSVPNEQSPALSLDGSATSRRSSGAPDPKADRRRADLANDPFREE